MEKDVEPLEFEAVFGLFEFIDWTRGVNRDSHASKLINSRYRMVSPFGWEHKGSDRCRTVQLRAA